jgi:hypothetical protein
MSKRIGFSWARVALSGLLALSGTASANSSVSLSLLANPPAGAVAIEGDVARGILERILLAAKEPKFKQVVQKVRGPDGTTCQKLVMGSREPDSPQGYQELTRFRCSSPAGQLTGAPAQKLFQELAASAQGLDLDFLSLGGNGGTGLNCSSLARKSAGGISRQYRCGFFVDETGEVVADTQRMVDSGGTHP